MQGLAGKSLLVAGGASGIGKATALRLAREGARVVVADVRVEGAKAVADTIRAGGGDAQAVAFDLADEPSIMAMVDFTCTAFGGLDGIHINAADLTLVASDTTAVDVDMALFDRTIQLNLRGHLLCARYAIPRLLERGGGAVVFTSSNDALSGPASRVSYAASKSGINAIMRHVASTWGSQGVRSNAVLPGLIETETVRESLTGDARAAFIAELRSPRLGRPEDIAALVAFLLSDDGAWMQGQAIAMNGGSLLT